MTREKIIQGLYKGDSRAIKEVIKTLEQETCEDCISREALLDKKWDVPYEGKYIQVVDVGDIKDLPSVIPARKKEEWIPVSERLPKDKTYVLTTIKIPNRIAHSRSGWYEGGFFHNDNGDIWKATDMEVIAWMPLSEPYKE